MTLKVTIPANTSATVYVPTTDPAKCLKAANRPPKPGVTPVGTGDRAAKYQVESGSYVFTAPGNDCLILLNTSRNVSSSYGSWQNIFDWRID